MEGVAECCADCVDFALHFTQFHPLLPRRRGLVLSQLGLVVTVIHGNRHILIPQPRNEQIQILWILDIHHKFLNVRGELIAVVIYEQVHVDSVFSTEEERGFVVEVVDCSADGGED